GDDNRNVVLAAGIVSISHELPASLLGIRSRPNDLGDCLIRKHFGQPIGAEEHDIAGLQFQLMNLDLDLGISAAQGIGYEMATAMAGGLFGAEDPMPDHFLDQRMVARQLTAGAASGKIPA